MWYLQLYYFYFFFNDTATTEIYTLSLHDALPISGHPLTYVGFDGAGHQVRDACHPKDLAHLIEHQFRGASAARSEEHTSELQSRLHLVCRLLLEKKKETTQ